MLKQSNYFKNILMLLLAPLLMLGLCNCKQNEPETVTIYPCYFNQDVEGVDAKTICTALEQAGWELVATNNSDNYTVYSYLSKEHTNEDKKGIRIEEYPSVTDAAQAYLQESDFNSFILASNFVLYPQFFKTLLRISNCVITAYGNTHTELVEMLDLPTVVPLEATLNMTFEMCKDCDSVDIETVRRNMEADGYQFYATEFLTDHKDDGYTQAYIIISPEQDHIYAYTGCGEKPVFGVPDAYKTLKLYYEPILNCVGMHVVGFKDGCNVLCYGNSFEEIRDYFVQ